MINTLEMSRLYENQWVGLDRRKNVVDFGPRLDALWSKYNAMVGKMTFYFAAA